MEWLKQFVDLFLHLDTHLSAVISQYGTWTYLILFLIVFCETGLVVTPFLPGDSLLFVAGGPPARGRPHRGPPLLCLMGGGPRGGPGHYQGGPLLRPPGVRRVPGGRPGRPAQGGGPRRP